MRRALAVAIVWASLVGHASAHPGGLNADGCHNNRKTGDYHCHRGSGPPPRSVAQTRGLLGVGDVSYPNCAAARAAGAAPVRRGDPGYGRHLDRDGDGKGCE
ncbi:excalibur calcium-binding domain-containing protein [Phenylobacterium sp.]|uniref:excalibur calcium-binding domain-containing protein n=1 Tax=Phenylobacterium sp. TaxID=1871053 RepID=UPI003BACED64